MHSEAFDCVVIGAGVTGLAAALHLPGASTVVLEAGDEVGGVCATRTVDGYRFDRAGHFLHLRDARARALVEGLLPQRLAAHARRAAIHIAGAYVPHPFQAHLGWLPEPLRRECLEGFLATQGDPDPTACPDLATWFRRNFGAGITRHFLEPQNAKTYCCAPSGLDASWAPRYVPLPSRTQVVQGAQPGAHPAALGYNAEFLYPRDGGIEALPRAMAARLANVRRGRRVVSIDTIHRRVACADGSEYAYRTLVSTIPLNDLVGLARGLPPAVYGAAQRLRSVDVLDLRFGVAAPARVPYHWIYFPEPRFGFARVVIPSNVSPSAAPPGHTALHVEVNVPTGTPADVDGLCEDSLRSLRGLGVVDGDAAVRHRSADRIRCAYVVHDHARERELPRIHAALLERHVHAVGRYGGWSYGGMESAILDGIEVAGRLAAQDMPVRSLI